MGSGASSASAAVSAQFAAELERPADASDMESLADAQAEVKRLRALMKLLTPALLLQLAATDAAMRAPGADAEAVKAYLASNDLGTALAAAAKSGIAASAAAPTAAVAAALAGEEAATG
eukprot:PLAT14251.1.p2 GENE.PLAT14251.1~~PLAT14251.1.p2  ORF type:complete len:119 (+),score=49.73 PLAT14251.1:27-383(+)